MRRHESEAIDLLSTQGIFFLWSHGAQGHQYKRSRINDAKSMLSQQLFLFLFLENTPKSLLWCAFLRDTQWEITDSDAKQIDNSDEVQ